MQTIIQVAIGVSPLVLVSVVYVVRRRMTILPMLAVLCCLAVLVSGFFLWGDDEEKQISEQKAVSGTDYLYLAEQSIIKGDYNEAEDYLAFMSEEVGDSSEKTLCYARLAAVMGDYDRAGALYEKLKLKGEAGSVMTEADNTLYAEISGGSILNQTEAAAELAAVKLLKESGGDISEYGYTEEQVSVLERSASGDESYAQNILDEIERNIEERSSEEEERCDNLADASEAADSVIAEYESYKKDEAYDEDAVDEAYDTLKDIYKEYPDIFGIDKIDEAYVKALVILGEYKKLGVYADETDSQTALIAIAQLLINGSMNEKELPDGFVSITEAQLRQIRQQAKEALEYIKEHELAEDSELRNLTEKVENLDYIVENLVLTEINSRLNIENESLENQSELYLGSSAIDYTIGNNDAGDKDFENSLNTASYSENSEYAQAMNEISKIINGISDSDEVKNIGDYIENAYKYGVVSGNGNNAQDSEEEASESAVDILTSQGTTYVSKKKAMVNISGIDISNFPEITVNIQTGDPLDLDALSLTLTDCGVNISEFTIEKVDYDESRIYIVCDKSGSMSGSEETLKAAVRSFAESMTDKEMVAVVGFSSDVEFASELTDDASELEETIDRLNAGGGTNIASGAFYALDELEGCSDSFNVIVLMTDGADSSFYTDELNKLSSLCIQTNTVVYTIGLGSEVHPEYLEQIAEYGNGTFVYCYDVDELESLYSFIHGQVENNYKITFTAKDTATNQRTLTVTDNQNNVSASRDYTLGNESSVDENGNFIISDGTVTIGGFSNKKIYKKDTAVSALITGAGFEKDMSCSVSVIGDAYKGSFVGVYVSENIFKVTIPEQMPAGTYDVTIIIDGYAVSDKIEVILPGNLKTLTYGAYTFSAMSIVENGDSVTLSGDVSMNDYIHFNGEITLEGDVENDLNIRLVDSSGYYISFSSEMPGLLGKMCSNILSLPAIGSLTLYNDQKHLNDLDEYQVDESYTVSSLAFGGIIYEGPSLAIYPHKISISIAEIQFNFPLQKQLFDYSGISNPFEGIPTAEIEGVINSSGLYAKGSVKAESINETISFSVLSLYLDSLSISFDTFKNDYELELMVGTEKLIPSVSMGLDKEAGYGFSIAFKNGKWDELKLYANFTVPVLETPPVTLSGFFAGISDLSSAEQGSGFAKTILQSTLIGGCDIAVFKVADMIPAASAFFDKLSLVTFEETTLSLSVLNAKLSLESTVKLLGMIECGNVDVRIGKYDYEDYLLGIDEDEVIGFYLEVNAGPKLDYPNFELSVQGSTVIALNNAACALKSSGSVDYDINLYRRLSNSLDATLEMALVNYNEFVIIVRGTDLEKNKDAGFKISINGWDSYFKLY